MNSFKYILIILLICPTLLIGQDVHISTFDANPIFLNPANTGFHDGSFRINTVYRNQWSTISKGYNTYLLSAETKLYNSRVKREGIGFGLSFLADNAGSLKYGEQNIGISFSYFKLLNKMKEHYLSFGLSGSSSNWGYNIGSAYFGKDPIIIEGIPLNDIRTFDFSIGIHWQIKANNFNHFQAGLSIFHINEPSLSYFEDSDIKLPRKINLYFIDLIPINSDYSLRPALFYQNQFNFNELIIGSDLDINTSLTIFEQRIISLGLYYRTIDALILMGKYQYNNLNFGISYDINLSKLTPVSKSYGGVEVWLRYSFSPSSYKKAVTNIPCPVF